MYQDIELGKSWRLVEKINKGWSSDLKFYIETMDDEKLLLRISDRSSYEQKQKEFDIICLYSKLGFTMSNPIAFGRCNHGQSVYMLCTWVEGIDLCEALPTLSESKQYELGCQAGTILKKIHSQVVPVAQLPTQTKIAKKLEQLERYINSDVRIENDEIAIQYIKDNSHKMWKQAPVYQHGDFHPGNLILTPDGNLGVIDFNRFEISDPYEEFYKLESFGIEVSIPYCIGQIDAYFEGDVPLDFWETLAVYVAHASLFSIKWAETFGQEDIDGMVKRCLTAFEHFNYFKQVVPSWYKRI